MNAIVHHRMRLRTIGVLALFLGALPVVSDGAQTPTFGSLTQLVPLYATVMDKHKNSVTTLTRDNFKIYEDKVLQKIKDFRREDVPVSICIVVDNSGSMREKRLRVAAAAMTFVRTSNPQDEVCIVNFNEDYYLDRDFTSNPDDLKDALEKIDSRGGTAFYDSLIASLDHLRDSGKKAKKVLLVITDGVDNASRSTLEQTERAAHESEVVIYTIGLFSDERGRDLSRAKKALNMISDASGGVAFFPNEVREVEAIATQIAHDIRNQYVMTYVPAESEEGRFHAISVVAEARGLDKLTVRTRTGYYTPKKQPAASKDSK
jgi:Ca-activated chloride channel family protein